MSARTTLVTAASENHLPHLLCWAHAANEHASKNAQKFRLAAHDLVGDFSASSLALLHDANPSLSMHRVNWSSMPAHAMLNPPSRTLDMSRSDQYAHVESALKGHYAWKPHLIASALAVAARGACVVWADGETALRSNRTLDSYCAHAQGNDGFWAGGLGITKNSGSLGQWTHPGMLDHLRRMPLPSRGGAPLPALSLVHANLSSLTQCDAGVLAVIQGSAGGRAVMEAWLSCADDEACIAPHGSTRGNHRQDQSALSLVAHAYRFDALHHGGELFRHKLPCGFRMGESHLLTRRVHAQLSGVHARTGKRTLRCSHGKNVSSIVLL